MTTAPAPVSRFAAADSRLSRAASAIWRRRTAGPDPMGDPSGDCGDLIAAWHRAGDLRAVTAAGYPTPGEYNTALRAALGAGPPGPDGRTRMSHRTYQLLSELEIDSTCPRCGSALTVTRTRTGNYGGGWDTSERCPGCGYAEVYV